MKAECQCGQLSVELPQSAPIVVACHCIDCQRRTGSPFGVLAYYPADDLAVTGASKRFERSAASGGVFETFFCPACGSTVYAKSGKHPTMIGVAVGAIADPTFPAPARSVWERSMHHWVVISGDIQHFPQGRS
ncbi:MAG TPA: GFA family protein [Alphaproteobacteria bacterium]|nr:GFA family protein [Alphaproteobacteria bacterium]